LARIVDPKPGERISDPCCGSASLLIRAGEQVPADANDVRNVALFGQELNGATWALAKMNMYLHGFDQARIERGDTIRSPKLVEGDQLMRFDVVVANPPFSLDKWGADMAESDRYQRFHRGVPPKSKGDYAFISHMIETANPVSGRVGVVVPHGVLFRGGSEAVIRRRLIEENLLDGVVGLPANLFFGVSIPAALLFFRRGKSDDSIFFIDASREFEKGKNQNRLRPQDIEKIVETWRARRDEPRYARRASLAEVAANEFSLNIPLYVGTNEEEGTADLGAVQLEIARLETELDLTRRELATALKELGL
jgi:type I restriction enzyme M protein